MTQAAVPKTAPSVHFSEEEIQQFHGACRSVPPVDQPTCIDGKALGIAQKILASPKGLKVAVMDHGVIGKGSSKDVCPGIGSDGKIYAVGVCDMQKVEQETGDSIEYTRVVCETEAVAARVIRSPHVVRMPLVVEDGDVFYFVMEYCPRGEFFEVIADEIPHRDHAEPLKQRLQDCLEIARGLAAVHDKNIIHRDVKSENILLDDKGHKKLSDFGFMVHAEDPGRGKHLSGSAHYCAPERLKAKNEKERCAATTKSSDIWSLGVVFYNHLVLASMPWQRKSDGEAAAMIKGLKKGWAPKLTPTTSRGVKTLLTKIFQLDAKDRPDIHQIIGYLEYLLFLRSAPPPLIASRCRPSGPKQSSRQAIVLPDPLWIKS